MGLAHVIVLIRVCARADGCIGEMPVLPIPLEGGRVWGCEFLLPFCIDSHTEVFMMKAA